MVNKNKLQHIPEEILSAEKKLRQKGFEAYLVGGCVRDLLQGKKPKDWDITTSAKPEDIIDIFEKTFYENSYGTVGVVNEEAEDETLRVVEITPYRLEAAYSDNRRPDSVSFSEKIEDDLKRRDFTINAIAYSSTEKEIVDPYKGQKDIKDKIIRTVGNPEERFDEDALRLMRAVRLATSLGFTINKETSEAIKKYAYKLEKIAIERIREEFIKIIMSEDPMKGIVLLHELKLLQYILPELEKGIDTEQNGDHIYDVWEHNLRALQHSASRNWPLHVRLAALLHDIAKPETRRWSKEKSDWTFYGHDVVGGRVSRKTLTRMKFPKSLIDVVSKLVRNHLFFSDIDKITLSAVRRIIKNVGPEYVWDLMKVRACDRIGMGRPKETPYRLRKYEAMIEEAMRDPVSVSMLKIDGLGIINVTHEKPGPRIGFILHALLEEVLDDPKLNNGEYLTKRVLELAAMPEKELEILGKRGQKMKEQEEEKEISKIRKRHWVQ